MTGHQPDEMSLDDLRTERSRLQAEEHAVSYVRRLVQGRLDLVRAEQRQRAVGGHLDVDHDLADVLGAHVIAPDSGPTSARPPRPMEAPDDHPLIADLDARCEAHRFHDLTELADSELASLAAELDTFEHACSAERHALFQRLDALTAELVRRYRDGGASVDTLLSGHPDA